MAKMTTPSLAEFKRTIAARMDARDWQGAAAMAEACRSAWPTDPAGWLLGSFVALLADRPEAALSLADGGIAARPRDLACLIQRAECLLVLGRRAEAIAAADAAAEVAGDEPAALDAVSAFLVHANEHPRAIRLYDRALAAAPRDTSLLLRRATRHRYVGDFGRAAADYDAVLALDPDNAEAFKARGELRRQDAEQNSIASLEAALARNPTDPDHAVPLHFALAKAYEDTADYATSWRHVRAANGLERTRIRYDAALDRAMIDGMIAAFPDVEPVASDTTGESPIFIVGLPRTGTTLVDQILGSHSQVDSAGELAVFYEAIGGAIGRTRPPVDLNIREYAALVAGLDGSVLAAEYLMRVKAWRGDRPRFSDKNVTNFFYIGPILRAFPRARIVHLTRHPMAACYANYKNWFRRGFPYSFELGELADFYVGYRRLMAHWHRILPGRILDLAYEDIVTSQEATTRMLLDYCGLPFEPACLEFHANPKAITTASSVQARQPLYDSSLEQWRHYAAGLAPVRERLAAAGIAVD
jgi:tetratricopeptide (TPR) repeat protein